jgi:hypothetical protein
MIKLKNNGNKEVEMDNDAICRFFNSNNYECTE